MTHLMRHLAKLACILVGGVAGWTVLISLNDLFHGSWVPPAAGIGVMIIVVCLLYFPLARPIADIITDRLAVAAHRGKHIRTGSGISDLPTFVAPPPQPCNICGEPGGPICAACEGEMRQSSPPRQR